MSWTTSNDDMHSTYWTNPSAITDCATITRERAPGTTTSTGR